MDITKKTGATPVSREELEQVNALTRRELGAEEVYLFSVRLCDNEVDRDGERFSPETLEELCPMFVGKSGIFDHQWSARGQSARLYKCEVVREPHRLTRAGDGYCWLKGYAYMLRTGENEALIGEIDAGIKKEVSVGCSVERKVCSICGADVMRSPCEHRSGERYDGQVRYVTLEGALDAYEFSFVAVPAQPAAGVVKGLEHPAATLKELASRHPALERELALLEEEAALGRACLKELREEVVRLGMLAQVGLEHGQLRDLVKTLAPAQLELLKVSYGQRVAQRYPVPTQLSYGEGSGEDRERDAAFLI